MRRRERGRGPLRGYLEARGLVGAITGPHLTTRLRTSDGVRLEASYLNGPAGASTAVLLAHGFAAHRRKPAYARLAAATARHLPVLSLDLRGHGGSQGSCTLGDREALDIAAAVAWLHRFGHARVVVVGVSMGATAALHAVAAGVPAVALVTVSAPAWFHEPPHTAPLQRLHAVWTSPTRRRMLRLGLGVRLDGPAGRGPLADPVELVAGSEVPYLIVHGRDDPYFPVADAEALAAAAGTRAVVWLEPPGFGHAEDGLTPAFCQRLAMAVVAAGRDQTFPAASGHANLHGLP